MQQSPEKEYVLRLTEREADYLLAATTEFYQKMEASFKDTTFGAMITEQRVLDARSLWLKAEAEVASE